MYIHLVFLQVALLHHFVSLLLECDDDESNKDVDKKEGENHKVYDIENGHLHSVSSAWAVVFLSHIHRVLENSVESIMNTSNEFNKKLKSSFAIYLLLHGLNMMFVFP